ncbi:photosynthetic reaction center cytochrome c subunit [Phaeovibrio sulfidiphilus]|uniref:Photosynthetic reaction center cytochrome c subunit n=1 Tax=Phaeovibrio sulfidiphilus TaxID=1220600 RepID=A0A8J6YQ82_9PROT|nr:photosynthetic reaction center cytochrome PufC [Phaeovibrio sulfidiphilus]MBE1237282.1 photosynthetic reaction center cytochrome c subunit [Phaeovibrio sulfidiphilus]
MFDLFKKQAEDAVSLFKQENRDKLTFSWTQDKVGPTPLIWKYGIWATLLAVVGIFVVYWTYDPVNTQQLGFRGTGMQLMTQKGQKAMAIPAAAEFYPEEGGEKAGSMYQQVHIPALADMDNGTFTGFMQQITDWVAPTQGCYYCHVAEGLEFEAPYTKIISRRMIEMVQELNSNPAWRAHLVESKVTCWTCHRGVAIPNFVWYQEPPNGRTGLGNDVGQNKSTSPGMTAMHRDPYTPYIADVMADPRAIRVMGTTSLPVEGTLGKGKSLQQTEQSYSFMISISLGLGVNCTHCHNTQNFADWSLSRPQRLLAWEGMNMIRDLNRDWLSPLSADFSAPWIAQTNAAFNDTFTWEFGSDRTGLSRLGKMGDAPKANCGTCHNGEAIPLLMSDGVTRADLTVDFPQLLGPPMPRLGAQ